MIMNSKTTLYSGCIFSLVLLNVACNNNSENNPRKIIFKPLSPLESQYTEIGYMQEFPIGQGQGLKTNPRIVVRVVECDIIDNKCMIEIKDNHSGILRKGEVILREYVSFAPDMVGRMGLQLEKLQRDNATFYVRGCMSN
jgi:hypothetical protein